jgi:hypothetical protein
MKSITGRIVFYLALFIIITNTASAQEAVEASEEIWPEVDVFVQVNPKVRLFFLGTVSRTKESKDTFEGQVGAHVDYLLNKHVFFRTGYRRGISLGETDDPFSEHRFLVEQTFKLYPRGGFLLSDRNRVDFRWVNDKFSMRYRNRLTLEREFMFRERAYTPYASIEAFYDSRYDTWNRNRYAFGIQWTVRRRGTMLNLLLPKRNIVFDLYFMRQNDSRSQPNHVNAIGVVTIFYF